VEDDYVAAVAGAPYFSVHDGSLRWVVIRSLSKVLGPDLRVAPVAGDPLTISRVEGRQLLGAGWVSHLLQQTAAKLWASPATGDLLARLSGPMPSAAWRSSMPWLAMGLDAHGRSGLGVWVPVIEESAAVQQLLERGWAVSAGERFRFSAPPGIRITTTDLEPADARLLAAAIREVAHPARATYAG